MRRRRTPRAVALVSVVMATIVALAACGTDNNTQNSNTQTAAPSTPAAQPDNSTSASAAISAAQSGSPSSSDPAGSSGTPSFTAAGFTCATGTLRSSGSTAQGKVMAALIAAYNAKCHATVTDYGGGGSGKGVSDFLSRQTDFGGSDSAMSADELARAKAQRCSATDAIDLPMVVGPIAVGYNLPDVGALTLTPKLLAGIFGGTITHWNDPKIEAANPHTALPDLGITSVHRSEDSGTTDNFTRYLAAAGGWTFPGGKAWSAPGGVGAQGSDGVATAVQTTVGAISYVEWGYAQQDRLAMAQIDNGAGPVELTARSAGAAAAAAAIVGHGKDLALKIDYATKSPGVYPIVLVTYELVCSGGNGAIGPLLGSFLGFAATDGQALYADLGAAPLPPQLQRKVIDAVRALA